ncbi:MAG TPA: CYCXC family (seleno)protein [Gemmatimonadaceae bacterium]|nr:CYCXC family (seleno)protein [Gemmatimonadaceae bacterium]
MSARVLALLACVALPVSGACGRESPPLPDRTVPFETPRVEADAAGSRVVDPAQWTDPFVRRAYEAARRYAHVLERLYCYCRCKENIGHRALLECFESDHGSMCDICMTEALIAARMTQEGRSPEEIQKAIDAYYGAG